MGLLKDWGFSANSWQGQRGEYWVAVQVLLILGFVALPVYRPATWNGLLQSLNSYWIWAIAASIGLLSLVLFAKGLLDLGKNLTPLPHPRDDGELVQSGIYSLVRHPVYSGVILGAIAGAIAWVSLSHLLDAIVLFLFFDAKSRQEENWLTGRHPAYTEYRQRVKKLIPWLY